MIIKVNHRQVLFDELYANRGKDSGGLPEDYSGSPDPSLFITSPVLRRIVSDFSKKYTDISFSDFETLLDSLYKGKYTTEKYTASFLLGKFHKHRKQLNPEKLDEWLNYLNGWAQIDTLCQSTFTSEDMDLKWPEWLKLIRRFSIENKQSLRAWGAKSKRRASLVLLTGPVRNSTDPKFRDLAFENIEKLKGEKDILITKAVSWLLRSMIKNHRVEVSEYLKRNKDNLPKIAVREALRKLTTGRKS